MIKHINHQNFQTTPFVAAKNWHLFNVESDDLVILESTGSEDTVALEFIDYSSGTPVLNTACSIALEQQGNDRVIYQEGTTGSGAFFPGSEPTNRDGTFKRLVHSQIKSTFYNKFNNPTQIFGMEYIDFPLGKTFRDISEFVRIFTVPRNIFGQRIIENTVHLADNSLDDNVEITDDGYQNLVARFNLFSKVQEVRVVIRAFNSSSNIIISDYVPVTGSNESTIVRSSIGFLNGFLGNAAVVTTGTDSGSVSIGFLFGTLDNVLTFTETMSGSVGFYSGSLQLNVITASGGDSGSVSMAFYTGSLTDQVVTSSGGPDIWTTSMGFFTGSMFNEFLTGSGNADSWSVSMGFLTGSMFNEFLTASRVRTFESSSLNIGFLNGTLT
jgi:hypothetical protein